MMGNNALGDCTCAALGHALQVWTANANPPIDTEPDANIIQLYSEATGYKSGDASTDKGGVEQDVLTYAMLSGIPVTSGRHRISAFVEIDPANFADVKLAIYEAGLCYLGFEAYRMTWAFWSAYVDEAYLIADADWITATGKSPAGLALTDLETQMQALRQAA